MIRVTIYLISMTWLGHTPRIVSISSSTASSPSASAPAPTPAPAPASAPTPPWATSPPLPPSPGQRPAVLHAKRNSSLARERMELHHNRGKRVHQFEQGNVVTIKVPDADHPRQGAPPRLFALVRERKYRGYILQTTSGIINRLQHASNLRVVNQSLSHIYAAKIHAASNTSMISMRQAALEGRTSPQLVVCACKKMPCSGAMPLQACQRSMHYLLPWKGST